MNTSGLLTVRILSVFAEGKGRTYHSSVGTSQHLVGSAARPKLESHEASRDSHELDLLVSAIGKIIDHQAKSLAVVSKNGIS